ncbi:MAG TPA: GNAT family N-acetyltransferase, partial [Acidimicrobiia bacterium]|nr:GNAT family N-acetyltransferase [Acidimicrobiia bacterium]
MAFDIQQIDATTAPESLLRELAAYYEIVEAEDLPGDPPTPAEAQIAEWRHPTSRYPVLRWALTDDDGIGAVAVVTYDIEQNLENGSLRLHVHPDKRGRGYARAIATPVFDHLESQGRQRLDTWVKNGDVAESLVRQLGMKRVYEDKRSRLDIADLDMDLMQSWVARARERAPDYELVYYESPLPEEMLQKFCDLAYIMNTAPREDFVEEDEILTPETWREMEDNVAASKCQLHNLIAVHQQTGDFAGYTQI